MHPRSATNLQAIPLTTDSRRRALVTGASRGFGAAVAEQLRATGWRVTGIARHGDGPVDEMVHLNLGDPEAVAAFRPSTAFNVLINNAAVYLDDPRRGASDIVELAPEILRDTIQINYLAATSLTLKLLPLLSKCGGRVANVSSGMGRNSEFDDWSYAYRVSKLALNSFTVSLARACLVRRFDLSVFSFCPGWIRTEMGTHAAPRSPGAAAKALLRLLERPVSATNGRFFRLDEELDWTQKRID